MIIKNYVLRNTYYDSVLLMRMAGEAGKRRRRRPGKPILPCWPKPSLPSILPWTAWPNP